MFDSKKINDIAKRLAESLPTGVTKLSKDVEKNFRSILHGAFNKMDLVTREEFDAQKKVLQRTRSKLERLEKRLKELEGKK